ncbi:uncharacterized protein A4U43_C03F27860 [Asparagus officinalis]|uniref:Retrotransposon Copia-like N-terminal domain-containing protein n=1 Tax=Asparagus officinalis TaxID=4686 RepID=A0A5P1FDG7_ASPOF|nr:uncharacterized protein A4U43_C03F27860 [Asparagus officinalis]
MTGSNISSATTTTSTTAEILAPKVVLGTTVKLNGTNYLLWAQAFRIFIGAQNKLAHLLTPPLASTDPTYPAWISADCCVMTWLLNNMEAHISSSVMFSNTTKETWENLKIMYDIEKNASRVFELYEQFFLFNRVIALFLSTLVTTGVTTVSPTQSPPSIDQSVIFSGRGRGRGHGRGHDLDVGGGRGPFGGRPIASDRSLC